MGFCFVGFAIVVFSNSTAGNGMYWVAGGRRVFLGEFACVSEHKKMRRCPANELFSQKRHTAARLTLELDVRKFKFF